MILTSSDLFEELGAANARRPLAGLDANAADPSAEVDGAEQLSRLSEAGKRVRTSLIAQRQVRERGPWDASLAHGTPA